MIKIDNKVKCCGCTACVKICPQKCIEMKEDEEGFFYPNVDVSLCVNCGACDKVCPVNNKQKRSDFQQEAYIVQNRDMQILKESTAGGAFSAIAEYVIQKGGVVFGVTMLPDYTVQHIQINRKEDLRLFRNSKYVQSNPGDTFIEAREILKTGRLVCYSGTPCQIEGLRSFLKKEYTNLILVDVVCRAVPSPGVWKNYIESFVKKFGKQITIRFRDKSLGYQYSTMELTGVDGKIRRGGIESQQWLRMFFSGMIIRPSCTECPFRKQQRNSDFTIWDCFTVHSIDKTFNETCGTTRVLIHSQKGHDIFESIKEKLIYKKIPVEIAVKGVKELLDSPKVPDNRYEFFKDYNHMEFENLLDKYYPIGMKEKLKRSARIVLYRIGIDRYVKRIVTSMKNRQG